MERFLSENSFLQGVRPFLNTIWRTYTKPNFCHSMYSEVSISNRLLLFIIQHFLQLMTLNRCRLLLKLGKFSVLDFYLMPTFIDFQHFQKDFSISTIIITINIDIYLMNGVNFQFSTLIIVTTFI